MTIPVVPHAHVLLFINRLPLEILIGVAQLSPKITIGSDLYTVSRSTFLNQIFGVAMMIPVHRLLLQYCVASVKVSVLEAVMLPKVLIARTLME